MDRFSALIHICVIAATTIDDGAKFNSQTEAMQAAYLERGTTLDEIERQYTVEINGYPQSGITSALSLLGIRSCGLEKVEPMRTPTPLSERGVSSIPNPPRRRQRKTDIVYSLGTI